MKAASRNKTIALISALIFIAGLGAVKLDVLGLIPVFVAVIAFFTALLHGWLYWSGRHDSDLFEVYQEGSKTKAQALRSGLSGKKKKGR